MGTNTDTYLLDIELFPTVIDSLKDCLGNAFHIELTDETNLSKRTFLFVKGKKKGIVTVFIKAGGKNSFQIQGSPEYRSDCLKAIEIIKKETEIKNIPNKKAFSITNVPETEFSILIDFLQEEGFEIHQNENSNKAVKFQYQIKSRYKEIITITYYTNGRMLAQGAATRLMINFITYANEALSETDIVEEQRKFFDISDADFNVIDADMRSHIVVNFDKIDGKIANIFINSLIMLNSPPNGLTDYSAIAFPALRALEGVLKKRLEVGTSIAKEKVGDFFNVIASGNNVFELNKRKPIPNQSLKRYIENAYNIYHKHRHILFHFDNTIESTTIITYEQGKKIIEETLLTISKICKHW